MVSGVPRGSLLLGYGIASHRCLGHRSKVPPRHSRPWRFKQRILLTRQGVQGVVLS